MQKLVINLEEWKAIYGFNIKISQQHDSIRKSENALLSLLLSLLPPLKHVFQTVAAEEICLVQLGSLKTSLLATAIHALRRHCSFRIPQVCAYVY